MRTPTLGAVRTVLILWTATAALPQGIITTIAGTDFVFPLQPVPALQAPLGSTAGVAFDSRGNLYIADRDNHLVLKVDQRGTLTIVAGNGSPGFSGDGGPAVSAALNRPLAVAVDTAGNVYIADSSNNRVRQVGLDGIIRTVAGSGSNSGTSASAGDGGAAVLASLPSPSGLAIGSGGTLYVAVSDRIRKVDSSGVISTVAGNGAAASTGDGGAATDASVRPYGIAIDGSGNLFISEPFGSRVREVTPDGAIHTIAGTGAGQGVQSTGPPLSTPYGIAVDVAGNLFIADSSNQLIRKVSGGIISTVAGDGFSLNGSGRFGGDGSPPLLGSLNAPRGVAVDSTGNLYIADTGNFRIRLVSGGKIGTFAGNGAFRFAGDGSAAASASLYFPCSVATDAAGNLYIADSQNGRIRKVGADGTISTVAGGGASTSGPAIGYALGLPESVAVDAAGNLYIANGNILKISPSGVVTNLGGGDARDVAVDSAGDVYYPSELGGAVFKITPAGTTTRVAGGGSSTADGVQATSAHIGILISIAVDGSGNLYINDFFNSAIRKISTTGVITTVAKGVGGRGVKADAAGNLYVVSNTIVKKITPDGTVIVIAGNGTFGYSGDGGPATSAALKGAFSGDTVVEPKVLVDSQGNVYIPDTSNNRIRAVRATPPSYQAAPANLNFSTSNIAFPQTISLSSSIAGLAYTVSTDAPWLIIAPASGTMPAVLQVTFNPSGLTQGSVAQTTITVTAPNAIPAVQTIQVSLDIGITFGSPPGGPPPGRLTSESRSVDFALTEGASPSTARLTLSNQGGRPITFTATFSTATGGSWLQVAPAGGLLVAGTPVSLEVVADPGSLGIGTFNGAIAVASSDTGQRLTIPVTLAVSAPTQTILLSQIGLTFTAVALGGKPLPQTFGVLNVGQGSMSWTATAATLSGGSSWLTIDPGNGVVSQPFTDVSLVNVLVDPSGLSAGDYYGRIQVSSNATNSPQSISVALTVLAAGNALPPEVRPTGLIFTGLADQTPGSQDVRIGNPAAKPTDYQSGTIGSAFTIAPANATVQPDQPATLRVYPDFGSLAPGTVQPGTITLQFSAGPAQTVSVLTVVAPNGTGSSPSAREPAPRDPQTGCAPSKLFPVFTEFASSGNVPAGWPQTISVKVVDDCGSPMNTGSVVASFSNGDPALTLNSLQNGAWTGTWQPFNVNASGGVVVTVNAQLPNSGPTGSNFVSIGLQGAKSLPVLSGGLLSAVTQTAGPFAPGDLVLIRGTNLADAPTTAPAPVAQLAGASVLVGGKVVNLFYADSGQLVGQMPSDLPLNSGQQIYVEHGSSLGLGVPLTVAPTHPAVLAIYDITGGTPVLVDAGHPAAAGDAVVIYCAGLGGVDQNGALLNPVSVSVGGQNTLSGYAGPALPQGYPASGPPTILGGLASTGLGGLYQVTLTVPGGLPAGASPVVVSAAGQSSQPGVNMFVAGSQ